MTAPRPLQGITVLELAHYASGPFATMQLADAGARVVKIEQPGRGEHYRRSGDLRTAADGSTYGGYFLRLNRNKQSLALDTSSPAGYQLLLRLCQRADVLVTNLLPGTLQRQELDYPALREKCPALVYTSISGFGHGDVLPAGAPGRSAFASIVEAMSGFMLQVGDPDCRPHRSGISLADLAAGLYAALGTTLALRHRELTGAGQHVDIAMHDVMLAFNERALFTTAMTGAAPPRGSEGTMCPYDNYPAADGWLVICVMTQSHWAGLCGLLDRDGWARDPRFASGTGRAQHRDEIDPPLLQWLASRNAADAAAELRGAGTPASEIRDARAVLADPDARARQMLVQVRDGFHGDHTVVGTPLKLSADVGPGAAFGAPPRLGDSTNSVLHDLLDLDAAQIREMREMRIIS